MNILHTSDWHLGNSFHGHDRTEEHRHFLAWLLDVLRTRRPDALIVAGDVFDSPNPSAAAEQLFYDFLEAATEAVAGLQVVVTAGNHDSGSRLEAPSALLERHRVYVRGVARLDEKGDPDAARHIIPLGPRDSDEASCVCFALPYLRSCDAPAGLSPAEGLRHWFDRLYRALKKSDYRGLPVVAAAHFYASGADICAAEHSERLVVGGQDAVPADVAGTGAAYVALGHIHKAQRVGESRMWYAGSALPMSFSEKAYRHGVLWTSIDEEGIARTETVDYAPLRRLMSIPARGAASPDEALAAVHDLPKQEKGDAGSDWPYLEIRVAESQPEPGLMREVGAALADRAVRFCRMVRETPGAQGPEKDVETVEKLRTLAPLDMARRIFEGKYGAPLPEALEKRFNMAAEAAASEDGSPDGKANP